jgi:hypothetical protein
MMTLKEILAQRKLKEAAAQKVSDNTQIMLVADTSPNESDYEPIDEYDALGLF